MNHTTTAERGTTPAVARPRRPRVEYRRITCRELADETYSVRYLVDGVLVAEQPCLVAGPHKSLKTNLLVDLAISLATGGRWLGYWPVREPARVGLMSGESGLATLQETARRIAAAAGRDLRDVDGLFFSPDLPQLGHLDHSDALMRFIAGDELHVIILDPAYLCVPIASDKANNLFAIGRILRTINDLCQQAGCTFIIAHHAKRSTHDHEPLELSDVAWAGWAEWARQWILINRREPYDPDSDGEHRLWLTVGGSAGHSGLWGLDITEGRRTDPGGRRWDVTVRSAREVRAELASDRDAERRRQRIARQEEDVAAVAKALDRHPKGATKTTLRTECGMSGERFGRALVACLEREIAEPCLVHVSNHKKPTEGYRRKPDNGNSRDCLF